MGQADGGFHVHPDHGHDRVHVRIQECAGDPKAGVVDQNFEVLGFADQSLQFLDFAEDGKIHRLDVDGGPAFGLDLCRQVLQAFPAAGDQDQVVSFGSQLTGELCPDPRGCSRNQSFGFVHFILRVCDIFHYSESHGVALYPAGVYFPFGFAANR